MLNRKKIKPVALAIVKLCQSEGIKHAVRKFCLKISTAVSDRSEGLFGLSFTHPIVVQENWGCFFGWFLFIDHAYSFMGPTVYCGFPTYSTVPL